MDPAYAVSKAIKQGVIQRREDCEWCGSIRHVSAHHEDYGKPLEVVWLCIKCHTARHHMFGALTGEKSIRTWEWKRTRGREETVKKLFKDRARLVVYLEAEDMEGILVRARESGKSVVQWAREVLVESGISHHGVRVHPARRTEPSIDQGVVADAGEVMRRNEAAMLGEKPKVNKEGKRICPHGNSEGHYCLTCETVV